MLEVQQWLRKHNNPDLLKKQLGIIYNTHDDGRVIFNYSQIHSPKNEEIVRECRGLVLDSNNDWTLVARGFRRFFNWGETRQEEHKFIWENSVGYHKEDGSLILVYWWNGGWHINTRNSFGDGCPGDCPISWRKLMQRTIPVGFQYEANKEFTYIFELCSLYNKVVRHYNHPVSYLLSLFIHNDELIHNIYLHEAKILGLQIPHHLMFNDVFEAQGYLAEQVRNDKTFEGIVIRDSNNRRFKIKSPEYVALHRLSNNGNPASAKNLVRFVLSGETEEVTTYFPEVKPYVNKMQTIIKKWEQEIDNLWYVHHDEHSQKRFAMAVKNHPFASVLFEARKCNKNPLDIFRNSPELVLKKLVEVM